MNRSENARAFCRLLEENPVIAAIKDEEGLSHCLESDCQVVFILYGTICDIGEIVSRIQQAGKFPVVHLDLVSGLTPKEISVDFICTHTGAQGIISTRPGLLAIQRFFIIDSRALETMFRQLETAAPDILEILPGVMPRVTRSIQKKSPVPVIASGLILDKKDITDALQSGASGVSSTCPETWFM